jgi:hypothetical protein
MSGIAPKQNAFKFKIASHKQTSIIKIIWQEDEFDWKDQVVDKPLTMPPSFCL